MLYPLDYAGSVVFARPVHVAWQRVGVEFGFVITHDHSQKTSREQLYVVPTVTRCQNVTGMNSKPLSDVLHSRSLSSPFGNDVEIGSARVHDLVCNAYPIEPLVDLLYDKVGVAKQVVTLLKLKLARLLEKMWDRRESL